MSFCARSMPCVCRFPNNSGLPEAAPVSGAGIAGFGGGNFQPGGTFGAGLRPPSPSISSTGLGQGLGAAPMPSLPGFGGGFGKTLPVNSFPSSSGGSRTGPAGIRQGLGGQKHSISKAMPKS